MHSDLLLCQLHLVLCLIRAALPCVVGKVNKRMTRSPLENGRQTLSFQACTATAVASKVTAYMSALQCLLGMRMLCTCAPLVLSVG